MRFAITTKGQVLRFTALITLVAVAAPVLVVGGVMLAIPGMPTGAVLFGVALAFLIPLLIAPPLAYLTLSIIKLLHETIQRVDDHVKFDALTGVLNRSHFLNTVRGHVARGVLMIVDADHFKRINDERGHAAGDHALRMLAHTLEKYLGDRGIVGRLGGEEFGVFLPGMAMPMGLATADELRSAVRSLQMIVEQKPLTMTVSIGCVVHAPDTTIGQSLKLADEQLYKAKGAGRDRVMPSARSLESEAPRRRA